MIKTNENIKLLKTLDSAIGMLQCYMKNARPWPSNSKTENKKELQENVDTMQKLKQKRNELLKSNVPDFQHFKCKLNSYSNNYKLLVEFKHHDDLMKKLIRSNQQNHKLLIKIFNNIKLH